MIFFFHSEVSSCIISSYSSDYRFQVVTSVSIEQWFRFLGSVDQEKGRMVLDMIPLRIPFTRKYKYQFTFLFNVLYYVLDKDEFMTIIIILRLYIYIFLLVFGIWDLKMTTSKETFPPTFLQNEKDLRLKILQTH